MFRLTVPVWALVAAVLQLMLATTSSFHSATNGTLATVRGVRILTLTIPTPRAPVTSLVTIANTGTAPLAITAATLPTNVGGLYSITANTCSLTTPLAVGGTCAVSVRYATPAVKPVQPDLGALFLTNNGSTATAAVTRLVLVAQ